MTLAPHGLLTIVVPYVHTRVRSHALSNAWPDAPSSDRRRKAWEYLTRLESLHSLAGLLNFTVFLWNGRYVPKLYEGVSLDQCSGQISNVGRQTASITTDLSPTTLPARGLVRVHESPDGLARIHSRPSIRKVVRTLTTVSPLILRNFSCSCCHWSIQEPCGDNCLP